MNLFRDNPFYIKYYLNITRTFLLGIFPFIALLFFNIRIYQRFRRTRRRYTIKKNNNNSQQAKDLQLARILILIACMFFVTNLPRLLLNLYELFYINEMMDCKGAFVPSTWFICSTSVNHLLIVINCLMNFVIYCCYNKSFQNILFWKRISGITVSLWLHSARKYTDFSLENNVLKKFLLIRKKMNLATMLHLEQTPF